MPRFHHSLMEIGPLCNHDYHVLFERKVGTVFSKDGNVLFCNWRKKAGSKIW